MLKKVLRILFTLIGGLIGYILISEFLALDYIKDLRGIAFIINNQIYKIIFIVLISVLSALFIFLISPIIIKYIINCMEHIEKTLQKKPTNELLFGTLGAIIGLVISTLFLNQFKINSIIWTFVTSIITMIFVVLCTDIAIRKKEDLSNFLGSFKRGTNYGKDKKNKGRLAPKVLDTSVIIDGRILDICKTGFIEGVLIIPNFVLEELRHIADSADDLKRVRGRRGLDILNSIQSELDIPVEISEVDFKEINEVDSKLLKLAQTVNGKVITNDFNLNKVAQFQGVEVLNINDLANSIKPILLPGEEMLVQVVKDGKEMGQGIGYLDDGTMIVVEGGKKHIGENLKVQVTSVLQTSAGRMIFAKNKNMVE